MKNCKTFLKAIGCFLLDILCPNHCPICHQRTDTAHTLCPECYAQLNFLTHPCCKICGRPFEYTSFNDVVCGACMKKKPQFQMARAVLEYNDFSKKLVLAFKHGDHTELTPLLVKFLMQADKDIFQNIDIVIPVPLHWMRLFHRQYNQAALLAKGVAKNLKIPCYPNVLKRVRHTECQGHKHKKEREKNVKNAFFVTQPKIIRGKSVLLIDDVMTTGATLNECAKILHKAGAKEVKVLTIYRVITL